MTFNRLAAVAAGILLIDLTSPTASAFGTAMRVTETADNFRLEVFASTDGRRSKKGWRVAGLFLSRDHLYSDIQRLTAERRLNETDRDTLDRLPRFHPKHPSKVLPYQRLRRADTIEAHQAKDVHAQA